MAIETYRSCDNEECSGGSKHVYNHPCGHDICQLCSLELEEGYRHCPICVEKGKRKF